MALLSHLANALWAAIFASAFGIVLTTPARGLFPCALAGFTGSLVRATSLEVGVPGSWATVLGTLAVVLVAVPESRAGRVAPAALACGVFPLAASKDVFATVVGLPRLAGLQGAALGEAAVELVGSAGRACATTLGIALGIGVGLAGRGLVDRLARRRPPRP